MSDTTRWVLLVANVLAMAGLVVLAVRGVRRARQQDDAVEAAPVEIDLRDEPVVDVRTEVEAPSAAAPPTLRRHPSTDVPSPRQGLDEARWASG